MLGGLALLGVELGFRVNTGKGLEMLMRTGPKKMSFLNPDDSS